MYYTVSFIRTVIPMSPSPITQLLIFYVDVKLLKENMSKDKFTSY